MGNKKITVKYHTKKNYCQCCDRELDEVEVSGVREFDFYERSFDNYGAKWGLYTEGELKEVVEEFVYETIGFFAVSSHDRIELCEGEMDKVHSFAKEYIASKRG